MLYNKRERIILMELSKDSRAAVTALAKSADCSRVTVIRTIDRLVKQYDLKFTLEVNMDKLGLSERYIVAVKFREKPKEEVIAEFFKNDRYAQSIYLVSGGFDMLIYVVADSAVNYIKWETHIAEGLSQYGPYIMPSRHVTSHFGYIPMNDSFTDFISEDQKLDGIDKKILKLLNGNARASYKEIGKEAGISQATARYRLFRLVSKGIISRFTVAAQKPGEGFSSVVYFINYIFTKTTSSVAFMNARSSYLGDDDSAPLFNTFQLIFPISGTFRSFGMVLSEDKKTAMEKAVYRHRRIYKNEHIKMIYAEVLKPIKGLFPFRSLDIRTDYKVISWETASHQEQKPAHQSTENRSMKAAS